MDLILAFSVGQVVNWLYVILGLGLVIFFHELGHFAVAKWCNVYVERFSIGFGPIIWRYQKGETEYALSIIPFGGYVKMLGQDDIDPSQLSSEEIAEDPRSYSSKKVWQRMAIISAGVIMNILTAVLFFAYAYIEGIDLVSSTIGNVHAGFPAWEEGIEAGDKIVEINGREVNSFSDIQRFVALSQGSLEIVVQKLNGDKQTVTVDPKQTELHRMIGASPASGLQVAPANPENNITAAIPGTPAGKAEPAVPSESTIIAIDGEPITDPNTFNQLMVQRRNDPLTFTFHVDDASSDISTVIPPQAFRELGLQMEIGPVEGVKKNSPASAAGFKVGDKIIVVDGKKVPLEINPLKLPDYLNEKQGTEIEIVVKRKSAGAEYEDHTIKVTPQNKPGWVEVPAMAEVPLSVPAIGVSYKLINRVIDVTEGSPADLAGIQAEDAIEKISFLAPESGEMDIQGNKDYIIDFTKEGTNWAHAFWEMQKVPNRKIKLTYKRNKDTTEVEIEPQLAENWNFPSTRGLNLMSQRYLKKADSFGDALQMGMVSTRNNISDIYLTLRSLFTAKLSVKNLRGPLGIASVSYGAADMGLPYLALFLGTLSVNLAVLNFLPIPVLDGGHMVFLILEAVTRKRPSEKVLIGATYVGMAFVLGMMFLVLYLDIFVHWLGM